MDSHPYNDAVEWGRVRAGDIKRRKSVAKINYASVFIVNLQPAGLIIIKLILGLTADIRILRRLRYWMSVGAE